MPPLVAATHDRLIVRGDFLTRLEALLTAGLPAVLFRSGTALTARTMLNLLVQVAERCRRYGTELWVGDRVDLALACDADGVQLPEQGLSIAGARALAPGLRIGRSVHAVEAAREAARMGADHLVLGTIFASATHPSREPAGTALLEAVRRAVAEEGAPPILAIGGVTPGRVGEVVSAGASGVVAIGAVWESEDPPRAVGAFLGALECAGIDVPGRR